MLPKKRGGLVLMVESGQIDKCTHALDWEHAVYDTIMHDNAIKYASDWAKKIGNDTLIIVASSVSQDSFGTWTW